MANGTNGAQAPPGRRWAVVAGIAILIVLAAGLWQILRPLRIRVVTTKPTRQDISSTISTNGKVEPVQNFEAHAPSSTTVKRILVREGTKVRAGQLLLELDDTDARAQLARALAQLKTAEVGTGDVQAQNATSQADLTKATVERDQAQRNLDSLQRLHERGAASQAEVDAAKDRINKANADISAQQRRAASQAELSRNASAQAGIDNAKAAVEQARRLIANSNVTAPFDGTVYFLPAKLGTWVNPGDLLLMVADLSRMQVRTFVDEPEIGHLQLGESARISWDALPGRIWTGKVATIPSTVVSRGNRVVGELLVSVDNLDLTLLPNVNVGVAIVTYSHENALVLPREAVHEEDGGNFVYVINGRHLHRREVKLGVSNLTHVEILNGINDGDTIAVNSVSPSPLRDGVLVKVVQTS